MALTDLDEYLIHQTGDTLDSPEGGNPDFVDRLYVGCHSPDGNVHLAVGLGAYPNKNIMDGYIILRHGSNQHNIRVSRHLQSDRALTEIGPLRIKVLEPHKRWGVYLDENDFGIRCTVEFHRRVPPFLCPKLVIPGGVVSQGHYFQTGRFSGSIDLHGESIDVGDYVGVRDRSWGVRGGGKGGAKGFFHLWCHAHFPGFSISLLQVELGQNQVMLSDAVISNDDGSIIPIVGIRHRIEFYPGTRSPKTMKLLLTDGLGKERILSAEVISPAMYLNGGGYNRPAEDRGPLSIEGDCWDVSEPVGIDSPRFGNVEPIARFSMGGESGVGILESSWNRDDDYLYQPSF